MSDKRVFNLLFLCTGNSARSVLGEALATHIGLSYRGRFKGWSAGSHPTGLVNPAAIQVLSNRGLLTQGLSSKSWDAFSEEEDAPNMDVIITVCDNAAGEVCPIWPGHPASGHWGLPDPAGVEGQAMKTAAFEAVFATLKARLEALIAALHEGLDGEDVPAMLVDLERRFP